MLVLSGYVGLSGGRGRKKMVTCPWCRNLAIVAEKTTRSPWCCRKLQMGLRKFAKIVIETVPGFGRKVQLCLLGCR